MLLVPSHVLIMIVLYTIKRFSTALISWPVCLLYRSDFMERYLDLFSADAVDLQYATTTVHAEMKRDV